MSTNPLFVTFVTLKLIWWGNNHRVKSWKIKHFKRDFVTFARNAILLPKLIFKSKEWRLINLWMQIFDKTSSIPTFWGQLEKSISKVYLLFFEEIELYQCSWNNSSLSGQVKMKRLDPYYQKYSRLMIAVMKI